MYHKETLTIEVNRQHAQSTLNQEWHRTPTGGHTCALDWLLLRTWEDDGGGLPEMTAANARFAA